MRELKFRAYTDLGTFENVSVHSLSQDFGMSADQFYKHRKKPVGRENEDWDDLMCEFNFMEVGEDWVQADGIICEYTGIKDFTGNEVYEGDVIRCDYDGELIEVVVEWEPGDCRFHCYGRGEYSDFGGYMSEFFPSDNAEVIGNINAKPEGGQV